MKRIVVSMMMGALLLGGVSNVLAQNEINATLMQFPGITRVVVLTSAGHCLFDASGMDLCLMP